MDPQTVHKLQTAMPYVKVDEDCSLYYEILGEGPNKPTLTFINGTLQTTIYWKLITRPLAHRYRILLYDGRGQGESDLGSRPLSLERHVSDLKTLLSDLNVRQTSLIGISHGARVALAMAAEAPGLVARIVLCSISTTSTYRAKMIVRSWIEILRRHSLDAMVWAAVPYVFGRNFLKENEKVLDRIVKTIVRRNKTEYLRAHLEAMQHYPPLAKTLSRSDSLVLVLTGEDDPLVTLEGAREIARVCGGRHEQLKGVGHSIPAESPSAFNRLLMDFMDA